jgi:RNA polymerase sigma-70 factor (ECF subfamily)
MELSSSTLNPILLATKDEETPARETKTKAVDLAVAEIAARAAAGSIEAFEELAIQFEPRIYGFLCRHIGNAHDAQDLTQETFVRAWRAIGRFDPKRDFATWLFVIARRAAANHFRARRVHVELSDDVAAEIVESKSDEAADLWRVARKLKGNQYEALWLRYDEGFSVAQTARVMGLTTIHVKVILHRARKELARRIQRNPL